MQSVRIDRLEIHLKGIPSVVARSTAAGLGDELLDQLFRQPQSLPRKHAANIDRIDLGTLQAARGASPSDLRKEVAARVVTSLTSRAGER